MSEDSVVQYFKSQLLEAGEPVTVNHLASHLGSPFTKEMRKTMIGSRNCSPMEGLKHFLNRHPSIFVCKGGLVHLNPRQDNRDYIEEARAYFAGKLQLYGTDKRAPVTSLFGHRCQASTDIRYFSGKFIEDFTGFLNKHPDTFKVYDKTVVLVDKSDFHLEEYKHWIWKNEQLMQLKSIPAPVQRKILPQKVSTHQTKHVPRKVTKYNVEFDFTL